MAYHLAQEARAGLSEFRIPPEFGNRLFEYQVAAVKIAPDKLTEFCGIVKDSLPQAAKPKAEVAP